MAFVGKEQLEHGTAEGTTREVIEEELNADFRNELLYLRDREILDLDPVGGALFVDSSDKGSREVENVAEKAMNRYNRIEDIDHNFTGIFVNYPSETDWDEKPALARIERAYAALKIYGEAVSNNLKRPDYTSEEIERYTALDLTEELKMLDEVGYLNKEGERYRLADDENVRLDARQVHEYIDENYGGRVFVFEKYFDETDEDFLREKGVKLLEEV